MLRSHRCLTFRRLTMNTQSMSSSFRTIDFGQLAPEPYFQDIINRMSSQGFEYLAKISMNSYTHSYQNEDEFSYFNTYHDDIITHRDTGHELEFMYFRDTMLFFYVPNKAMIIKLALLEALGERDASLGIAIDHNIYTAHWSCKIFLYYDWVKFNLDVGIDINNISPVNQEGIKRNNFPYDPCVELRNAGFKNPHKSGDEISFYQSPSSNRFPVEKLVSPFRNILAGLNAYIYPSFKELGVARFPSDSFQAYHSVFWEMFPLDRIRMLAEHIQGSILSES